MTIYHITLRDRETQTVIGYYNGSWTTDRCRALTIRKRDAAEAHAARKYAINVRATRASLRSRRPPPTTSI